MMKVQKNIPQLRFPMFEDEWKLNLLGNTCVVKTGGSDTQDRTDDGLYPFFVRSNTVERINSFSFDGEAILTSGDGVGVGKNFHYINGKFDYHQRVYALREFKNDFSGKFIFQVFKEQFYKRVIRLSAKNSVDSVRMSMITEMEISFPTLPEQQKIASFLSAVDEKTQQLSRKKELLEQYKKGVIQLLFSGKLRFKDENGKDYADWEEKKLGEVCDVRDGTHDSPKYVNKGFPFITSKNLMKDGSIDFENITFINELDYNKVNQRSKVNINDILFGMIGTIGNPVIVKSEGFAIKNVALIKEKEELLSLFLIHFLKGDSINQQFFKQNTGGTQKFLSLSVIRNLTIKTPSIPEQQKIANFLSSIDVKIESTNQQIHQMQSFKKGLLQQLFV